MSEGKKITRREFLKLGGLAALDLTLPTNTSKLKLPESEQWITTFEDNFDGEKLDQNKWTDHFRAYPGNQGGRIHYGSNELQGYTPIKDGHHQITTTTDQHGKETTILRLEATKDQFDDKRSHTSAMITTHQSHKQKYGRFEIRAKVPEGKGLWPAFWLMPAKGGWPPEIDIAEWLGDQPNMVHAALHRTKKDHPNTDFFYKEDLTEGFHTYSLEWTENG